MGTLRRRHDEFVDVLLPRLEEVATLLGDRMRQGTDNDLISLREANARLRTPARQLSNFVGDLPQGRGCAGREGSLPLVWFASESRHEHVNEPTIALSRAFRGSEADFQAWADDARFTHESGHQRHPTPCPLWADFVAKVG